MDHLAAHLQRRVSEARVARLATVLPDGRPHIVPITFALDGEAIVTAVDHKPKTTTNLQRLRNIEAHPVASVIVDHYDDDWSRLWWVRADGAARILREGPQYEQAISHLSDRYPQYLEKRPEGPVIAVTVEHWSSWPP